MLITKKLINESVIYEISGILEHETIHIFQDILNASFKEKYNAIGLNFKKLKYINSLGIGYLVFLLKKYNELNIPIVIIDINDYNRKVFDMLHIMELFKFCDSNDIFINKYTKK